MLSKKSKQSHAVMRLIWTELQLVGALWPCHILLRHASKQHITRRMRIYQICQIYQSQMQSAICSGPDLGCDLEWVEWSTPQKACFSGLGCEMSVWVLEITAVMCHCLPLRLRCHAHDYRCAGVSSTMVVRWSPFQKVQPLEGHHAKGALTGQPKHSIMN